MMYAKDLMIKEVFTLGESDAIALARSLMSVARIRHIPIVNGKGRFVGLVSHRDVLAASVSRLAEIDPDTQATLDEGIPLSAIMRTDVTTISPDTPLTEAANILFVHKYGCLPVLDEKKKLVGILTEADFLRLAITLLDKKDKAQA